jgi:integrase
MPTTCDELGQRIFEFLNEQRDIDYGDQRMAILLGASMSGFPKFWARIPTLGELPASVTPHTLRHSLASLAADLGYSEPTIAALVGHKGRSITSRYVHSADAVLLAAADVVANHTAELMGDTRTDGCGDDAQGGRLLGAASVAPEAGTA